MCTYNHINPLTKNPHIRSLQKHKFLSTVCLNVFKEKALEENHLDRNVTTAMHSQLSTDTLSGVCKALLCIRWNSHPAIIQDQALSQSFIHAKPQNSLMLIK